MAGEEKRVPFACYVTLRGRMGNELSLWIETEKEKERKSRNKDASVHTLSPISRANSTIERLMLVNDLDGGRMRRNEERRMVEERWLKKEEICDEFTHDCSRASIFGYMTLLLCRSSNFDTFESTLLGNSQARAAVIPIITSFSFTYVPTVRQYTNWKRRRVWNERKERWMRIITF